MVLRVLLVAAALARPVVMARAATTLALAVKNLEKDINYSFVFALISLVQTRALALSSTDFLQPAG